MKRIVFLIVYVILPVSLFSQRWETVFPDSVFIRNGYINEDNTVEMVGDFGNEGIYLKVFDDGQYEMFYFTAPNGMRLNLQNLIPLDNGGYFVTGRMLSNRMDNTGELVIMILDEELNVENEQTIQVSEGFLGFIGGAAVKDDDGTIVLLATARREHPNSPGSFQSIGVLFRFTQSGDCLNSRYLLANPPDPICYMNQIEPQKLMNDPFNQQIMAVSPGQGGVQSLLFFDHDFNLTEDHFIDDTCFSLLEPGWQCKYVNDPDIGLWYQENEMLFVATQKDSEPSVNHPHVLVGKMNREGEVFEKREINKQDTLMYASQMVYANDSTIYVAVRCHTENYLPPFYPQVYLVNTQLEILGCISFWDHLNYFNRKLYPTNDEGCVMMVQSSTLYNETVTSTIIRLSREDFNPIWTIEEKPQQEVKVGVYPNPSKDKLHFDLSDVPTDGSKRLRIINFAGQVFIDRYIHGKGNTLTVGVANLPAGIYTYQIYDKEEILFCGRFLKE